MLRRHLDVPVSQPAIQLVLDAQVEDVDLVVEVGQVMFLRPLADCFGRPIGVALVVATVAIALVEPLLVLTLELVVEDDPIDSEPRKVYSRSRSRTISRSRPRGKCTYRTNASRGLWHARARRGRVRASGHHHGDPARAHPNPADRCMGRDRAFARRCHLDRAAGSRVASSRPTRGSSSEPLRLPRPRSPP
jgi:hypothetical protein